MSTFLCKFLVSLAIVSLPFATYSQITITNQGEKIYVTSGNIYIKGNYVNDVALPTATDDPQLIQNGSLFISGDITNNSAANIIDLGSVGVIELNGSVDQSISGTSAFDLNRLSLNKGGNLMLQKNIKVADQLSFGFGNLNVNGFTIELSNTGILMNESNSSRIYSTGTGTVNYTLPASSILTDPLGNLGLRLEGDLSAGAKILRGHTPQSNAGDGSINRYYDVELNPGDDIQKLRFYYFDAEVPGSITESELALYVSYDGGAVWRKVGGSVDAAENYIELSGLSITTNARFTLSQKNCVAPPLVDLGPATKDFCAGVSVLLDAGNPGAFYQWSTTENTQTISASSSNVFSVIVRNVKGCEGTDAIILIERPVPVTDFATTGLTCKDSPIAFINSSSISDVSTLTFEWDFGNPLVTTDVSTTENPNYTYSNDANYTVTLVVKSSYLCEDATTKSISVYPLPVANFSIANACFGQITAFSNSSSVPPPYGLTYVWDFDDGTSSTEFEPLNTFSSTGSYDVSLSVTSNTGCVDELTQAIDIYETPITSFATSNACEDTNLSIINSSSITSGSLTYLWDFGDATSSTATTPVKSFIAGGSYSISLTAISDQGCTNSASSSITIYEKPIAAFIVDNDCQDQIFSFTNTSTSAQGTLTYFWDFDNGSTSPLLSPTQNFVSSGNYTIQLVATSSFGCVDSFNQMLTVYPVPVADFTFTNACQNDVIPFNNLSSISSGSISYAWDFGDGNTSSNTDPLKSFSAFGLYDVNLSVTSDKGCVSKKTSSLEIYAPPVLDFGGAISTCGTSYSLDAENSGSTYLWSTGSTSKTITVTQNGLYSVTVTTSKGCALFEEVTITLQGDVVPNLGIDQVVCSNVTLDAGYPGSTYAWSTGETTRTINATSTNNYSVTVTDTNGCIGSDQVLITVNPVPLVNLGIDIEVCADQQVILDAANTGSSYLWSDNSTTKTLSVANSGNYSVVVTNAFGCSSQDDIDVTINPMPVNNLPASITVCDQIILNAANSGSTFLWPDNSTNPILNVTSSGIYTARVTTSENCVSIFSSDVIVNYSAAVNLGTDQSVCFGQVANLNAGNEGDNYKWSDGSTSKTLVVNRSGSYWVEVGRVNGCVRRDTIEIIVYPKIENTLKNTYQICTNEQRVLDASSAQGSTYQWFSNIGLLSTNSVFVTSNPTKLWVITKDAIGCSRTDSVRVETDTDPITARFLVASFVNTGDSVKFIQLSYPDPILFNWNFADGLASSQSDPVHTYLRPGDFDASLLVTDVNNCKDSKSKIITVRLLREEGSAEVKLPFIEMIESNLYPNPAPEILNLDLEFNQEVELLIMLYSMNGVVVDSKALKLKDESIEFDVRSLPSGVYVLKVFVNKDVKSMRFIKL
jgi:PKD repeat protein